MFLPDLANTILLHISETRREKLTQIMAGWSDEPTRQLKIKKNDKTKRLSRGYILKGLQSAARTPHCISFDAGKDG
jgi:hypothetical protein